MPSTYSNGVRPGSPATVASIARIAWDVVISGGGFGGFYAARTLERILPRQSARITLVNDVNFLLYTPFLPEAAAGTLEPRHVVTPLRDVLDAHPAADRRRDRARPGTADDHDGRPGGTGARVPVRPPGGRARVRVARAAGPGARGARDRLQVAVGRDLAAQPRDPVPGDGRRRGRPTRARRAADVRGGRRRLRRPGGAGRGAGLRRGRDRAVPVGAPARDALDAGGGDGPRAPRDRRVAGRVRGPGAAQPRHRHPARDDARRADRRPRCGSRPARSCRRARWCGRRA